MNAGRPRILAVLPGFIPSTMITVVKPLVNLHRAGRIAARIVLESQAGRERHRAGPTRSSSAATPTAARAAPGRRPGPRHAADLRPGRQPLRTAAELRRTCRGCREASRQAMLEEYLRAAALVRVYSQPLADRVAALNPRVVRTFAPVDLSLVPPPARDQAARADQDRLRHQPHARRLVRDLLAGAGARSSAAMRAGSRPISGAAARRRRRRAGQRPASRPDLPIRPFPAAFFPRRIRHRPGPLAGRRFSIARKPTTSSASTAPAASPASTRVTTSTRDCVEHEVTGLLVANDAESWHDAIERLI